MYAIPRFEVTNEQVQYAKNALQRSLDSFDYSQYSHTRKLSQDDLYRFFCGFLGEVLFADVYRLPRPKECYGLNGQDNGLDFVLGGENCDVKTSFLRTFPTIATQLSFILSLYTIDKISSLTTRYFFIKIVETTKNYFAYFVGSATKQQIKERKIGNVYKKGEAMQTASKNGLSEIVVKNDIMRIDATQLIPTKITSGLEKMPNFELVKFQN